MGFHLEIGLDFDYLFFTVVTDNTFTCSRLYYNIYQHNDDTDDDDDNDDDQELDDD